MNLIQYWSGAVQYCLALAFHRNRMPELGKQFYLKNAELPNFLKHGYLRNEAFWQGRQAAWQAEADRLRHATSRDSEALQIEKVRRFNELYEIGTVLPYCKSRIEGRCNLQTASKAYQLFDGTPVVDMQGIGIVLLSKVEHAAVVRADGRIFGATPYY